MMFWRQKPKQREQTTHCWCKNCGNELISSGSFFEDTDLVRYVCSRCGLLTEWLFDAPVPLLINSYRPTALRSEEV